MKLNEDQRRYIARELMDVLGVEGIRNKGGKWQRVNDEQRLEARIADRLSEILEPVTPR